MLRLEGYNTGGRSSLYGLGTGGRVESEKQHWGQERLVRGEKPAAGG